jgi:hypothetical protein
MELYGYFRNEPALLGSALHKFCLFMSPYEYPLARQARVILKGTNLEALR